MAARVSWTAALWVATVAAAVGDFAEDVGLVAALMRSLAVEVSEEGPSTLPLRVDPRRGPSDPIRDQSWS